jgi:hypothetical protein
MKVREMGAAAFKKAAVASATGSCAAPATGRLLGLDVGDWSMIFLGLALSGLLLALV